MFQPLLSVIMLVLLTLPVVADDTIERKKESKEKKPTTHIFIQYLGGSSVFSGIGQAPELSKQMSLTEIVDRLSKMPNLRQVTIATVAGNLRVQEYRQLARLSRVESLYIDTHAAIHGPELVPLTKMKRLKALEFVEARVKLSVLETLIHSKSLKSLHISDAGDVWERKLERLGAKFDVLSHGNYAP